jgi:hypothetical protein
MVVLGLHHLFPVLVLLMLVVAVAVRLPALKGRAVLEGVVKVLEQLLPLRALQILVAVVAVVAITKRVRLAVPASSSFPINPQQAEFLALPLHLNGLAQQV